MVLEADEKKFQNTVLKVVLIFSSVLRASSFKVSTNYKFIKNRKPFFTV
jgi:hypothetical protein